MSKAERFRRKNHKKIEYGKLQFKCPNCGMIVPDEVYERPDFGIDYKCSICGTEVFNELRNKLMFK